MIREHGKGLDLRGADLQGEDLQGADLQEAPSENTEVQHEVER